MYRSSFDAYQSFPDVKHSSLDAYHSWQDAKHSWPDAKHSRRDANRWVGNTFAAASDAKHFPSKAAYPARMLSLS